MPRSWASPLTADGAAEIARRSRGTPRIAGRLLRRVRDFAAVDGAAKVDRSAADAALNRLEVDDSASMRWTAAICRRIAEHHAGGPVGVETLAAALAEARDTLEDVIEPYPDPGRSRAAHQPRPNAGRTRLAASGPAAAGASRPTSWICRGDRHE